MTPQRSGSERPPSWDYLVAHHVPGRYDRTLAVSTRGRSYHFCARCTGEFFGVVAVLAGFLAFPRLGGLGSTPVAEVALALCPSAALVDWLTQTVGSRESNNSLRVASGFLLGVAVGGWLEFGVTGRWLLFGSGVAVLGLYLAIASLVLYRTGAWRRVVAEHFP